MGTGENELLVPRGKVFGHTALPSLSGEDDTDRQWHRRQQQQPNLRKFLLPLMLTLGIFGVSTGAARFLFPRKKIQRQHQQQQQLQGNFIAKGEVVPEEGDGYLTSYCASPGKTVMQGFDLTSYFSLQAGDTPVQGVAEHASNFNGYTFWFASEENKAQFEVRWTRIAGRPKKCHDFNSLTMDYLAHTHS